MTSLNMRCKSAVFAAMMVASSFFGINQVQAFSAQNAAIVGGTVIGLGTWVRLNSKGSKWDYSMENWRADFEEFLDSYNIFDAKSRATLLKLYDKWIVGRQLSIIDISYKTEDADGMVTTRKDKFIKSRPFGVMGLFDAYVIYQLKKIQDFMLPAAFVWLLINDPVNHFVKPASTPKTGPVGPLTDAQIPLFAKECVIALLNKAA
jgi:hypothetical protein